MPTITIDNQTVEVEQGTTILNAAARLGIEIPTLCYREGVKPQTACMVCVVKVMGRKGLLPSCATIAEDGMVVESETDEVRQARRMALELMLGDHVGDCIGPCQTTCPANMDIPGMIRLIGEGRLAEAVALVKERIPFPAVLGRICPELCERACRRGRLDAPVSIKLLKRFVGDFDIWAKQRHLPVCRPATGKSVAVVGAGPAGLAAAYYLRIAGHSCTVYDDRERPGGMLRYGVPESELPHWVLDAEIEPLVRMGIEFRAGVRVGEAVSLEELRARYDACVIAVGDVGEWVEGFAGVPVEGKALAADRGTHQSPLPDVFVAGAALSPSRYAVRAVAGGRSVAQAVHLFLQGEQPAGAGRPYSVHIRTMDADELEQFATDTPRHARVRIPTGQPGGYTEVQARMEAARCLHCECAELDTCRLRQLGLAYHAGPTRYHGERRRFERDMSHPLLVHEPGKCIACGLCVQIAADSGEELGLSFVGRGFTVRVAVPFGRPLSDGLREAARACAEACPTAALTLREHFPHSSLPEPQTPAPRFRRRRRMLRRPFGRRRSSG